MKLFAKSALVLAALSMTLTGCGSNDQPDEFVAASQVQDYVAVCVDPATEQRVDDDYCEEDESEYNPTFYPYFYPYGYMIPAMGTPVYGGYTTVAGGYHYGYDKKGGSSKGWKPAANSKHLFPKGYTAPKNATFAPAQPSGAQPAKGSKVSAPPAVAPAPVAPPAKTKSDTSTKSNTKSNTSKSNTKSSTKGGFSSGSKSSSKKK